MRNIIPSSATAILIGVLSWSEGATGQSVPVSEIPRMSCSTSAFNISVTVQPSQAVAACGAQLCDVYSYKVAPGTLSIDHLVISVSATQKVLASSPSAAVGLPLGSGDTATGFLQHADHEYPVRFNTNGSKSALGKIYIAPAGSKPRVGTVLVRSGKSRTESCLIATPGTSAAVDQFQPVYVTQRLRVAGGKCLADLIFDQNGVLVDAQVAPEETNTECRAGAPPPGEDVLVNGDPLRNNSGPLGITFGNGTTTCWGPPVPSIPRCICTRAPCP